MERNCSNLYRIGGELDKRGQSHSYLLVRKTGNLVRKPANIRRGGNGPPT